MSKIWYIIFLAIATSKEIGEIFDLGDNLIINFSYLVLFFSLVIRMIAGNLSHWVWREGLGIVGLSSLIYLILVFVGVSEPFCAKMDSIICLCVWIRSVWYSNNYVSYD
jgi:hypothetical protein